MFLHFFKHLYKREPKLFYLFGSFFIVQVCLILIKLEVTPFFLYGMFSEKVAPSDTFTERTILVDGKNLKTEDLWAMESLLFEETANHYIAIRQNNNIDIVQSRVEQRYPFLTQSFLYPFLKERVYNRPSDVQDYPAWFKERCSRLFHKNILQVSIIQDTYQLNPQRTQIKQIKRETVASF
jgi:hypothetical protein